MHRFKAWTLGLVSGVDRVVGRIENQEAVVDATLRDMRRGAARARVRLGRVERDGGALRRQLAAAAAEEARWTERARKTAAEDENKALECVRRRRSAQREIETLRVRLEEHERAESTLKAEIGTLDGRCRELGERRNLMRTRSSRAEAFRMARSLQADGLGDLEDVFERWEIRVAETEIAGGLGGTLDPVDALARAFDESEENEALRRELDELCGSSPAEASGEVHDV